MANIIPFAFRGELFSGTHNFANGGNSFKIALYTGNPYSTSSTTYLTDSSIASATFTAAGAAIYNDSKSDKLCVVLDFGGTKTATNGTFTIAFPNPSTPANAIISMA